jgi:hypothetical protein
VRESVYALLDTEAVQCDTKVRALVERTAIALRPDGWRGDSDGSDSYTFDSFNNNSYSDSTISYENHIAANSSYVDSSSNEDAVYDSSELRIESDHHSSAPTMIERAHEVY